jgi:hypothetical protein
MSVVGQGSALAMVEEVMMAAAEEVDDGRGGRGLIECDSIYFCLVQFVFSGVRFFGVQFI